MEVWLRWEGEYEQRTVTAVYASLEAAQAAHRGHKPVWRQSGDYWFCDWREEAVPPRPEEVTFDTLIHPVVDGVAVLRSGATVTVRPGITAVHEAVLPEGYVADFGTPARTCEFELERVSVTG